MVKKAVDKPFLFSVIILLVAGFIIFSSASLGLLAKEGGQYSRAIFSQTFFGLFLGSFAMLVASRIPHKVFKRFTLPLFILSVLLTTLVFVPGIGAKYGGAQRWIEVFGFSFQPSELLKVAFIVYLAALFSSAKEKIQTWKGGVLPLLAILGVVGIIILNQPDTDTFALMVVTGFAMFLVAGGKWRHLMTMVVIAVIGFLLIVLTRPYVKDRVLTFFDPSANQLTSGYQIQQSLIAIGSGGILGRGFGQSIQKFGFLPEPRGDAIYAVAGEEFGFMGSVTLVILFVFFAFRGLKIATRVDDAFGRLMVVGIVILITSQAFLNIGAMLGILPLSGNPLPFVSHGGTALLMMLVQAGIVLGVSRAQKTK